MKAAVYCGTRNVYYSMIPSMKSLLIHSDVDKIYFLIEDDEFPYELPPEVECINVSEQTWFPKNGPNYINRCSYMVLLRVAFPKIFPDLDLILTIDNDTIVRENVSDLWDLPMDNYYFAGAVEPRKTRKDYLYLNMGLAMINLKKMREDHLDDQLIYNLNNYFYMAAEQDCINHNCQGHILEIPSDYNCSNYTKRTAHRQKISHFACVKGWQDFPIVEYYRNKTIERNIQDNNYLDIIIPTHNNPEGLLRTLRSVYFEDIPQIKITVVDDCSADPDYSDLEYQFPNVNFLYLKKNAGPAQARQVGIDATQGSYVLFIDTDDIIVSKVHLVELVRMIQEETHYSIISYGWMNEESSSYYYNDTVLHGTAFKREFLDINNIRFTERDTFHDDDRAFHLACRLIAKDYKRFENIDYIYTSNVPIYLRTYDGSSITNKSTYTYRDHIRGMALNYITTAEIAKANQVSPIAISNILTKLMVQLYYAFLEVLTEHPEYLEEDYNYIRQFYFGAYREYKIINTTTLDVYYTRIRADAMKLAPKITFYRFIDALEKNEECPYVRHTDSDLQEQGRIATDITIN